MLLLLAVIVGICWLLGISVFHVASTAFHLLLVLAVIAIVLHFIGVGRRRGHVV